MKEHNGRISWAEWLAAFLVFLLVVIVAASVFSRYVLNIGIDWSDEVARLIFIWVVFIGAFIAFKRKTHVAVSALKNFLPPFLQPFHGLLVGLIEAAFMFIVTWFGVVQVMDTAQFGQVTPGLGVPMSWFYLVMPVTGLLITVEILIGTFRTFREGRKCV